MNKRAQITIYIIVGVVLVLIVGLLFLLKSSIIKEDKTEISSVPELLKSTEKEIKDCSSEFIENAIYYTAARSGTLDENTKTTDFGGSNVIYGIENRRSNIPSKEEMQISLKKYLDSNLKNICGTFKLAEFGEVSSTITINDDNVIVILDWPISLKRGNIKGTIERIPFESKIRLGKMRDITSEIVESQLQSYPKLCLTCISDIASANSAYIERFLQADSQIFLIVDETNPKLIYAYAVKY